MIAVKREEKLAEYESNIDSLRGFISKFRDGVRRGSSIEQESVFGTIISDYDSFIQSSVIRSEPTRILGDLEVTDLRIQSLIREKDTEILRLRDKIFEVERSQVRGASESSSQIIKILQDENLKLKNEINSLRVEGGSAELIASYKLDISNLNHRILELEQEKSNLAAELSNLRR